MSWLSSAKILEKVKRNADEVTKKAFHGIYPIDDLPQSVPHLPIFIIVNTHTHNLPGEHWLTIFIDENKRGEVFDSLALPMSNLLIRWLNTFTRKWKRNNKAYQHPLSSSCGAFALYFTLKRLRAKDFEHVTSSFNATPRVNERKVLAFYKQLK